MGLSTDDSLYKSPTLYGLSLIFPILDWGVTMCLPEMTVVKMQGLGEQMLTLAEPSDHDWDTTEGILEDIDFDLDVKLLLDSWVGFASMRN